MPTCHRVILMSLLGAYALFAASCVFLIRSVDVKEEDLVEVAARNPAYGQEFVSISSPLKVHLNSGETVIFPDGAVIRDESVQGLAQWYEVMSNVPADTALVLSFNDVAAVESFNSTINTGASVGVSLLASGVTALATPFLLVAIFGSCPTVYSESANGDVETLEAELFANSIAPLLEVRDVDRTGGQPDADNRITFEVRNEALETHYINHIELVAAEHRPGALVVPGDDGRPIALHGLVEGVAKDQTGRDVSDDLRQSDDVVYDTPEKVLANASTSDFRDFIEYTVPLDDTATDSAWVYLRLRNSLLGTVFFYDKILAEQGPNAIKWLAEDLETISTVVALSDFYIRNMGLRIDVRRNGQFEQVGRVREVGPIAFDHVAVQVPVTEKDSLRLRLRFITDAWRIDRVAVATTGHRPSVTIIPVQDVTATSAPPEWTGMIASGIAASDTDYGITMPGERFTIGFQVPPRSEERSYTYLLAMQGYYVEWIRGSWLRDNPTARKFIPSDSSLVAAIHQWTETREEFEKQFFNTRIAPQAQ